MVAHAADLSAGGSPQHWLLAEAGPGAPSPFADGGRGTLYLDEVSRLAPDRQAGLLQALSGESLGGDGVRLLAGSSRDPRREVERGALLEPLHRRLSAATVLLPPLRERPDDIPLLARHFVSTIVEINHLQPIQVSAEALSRLARYGWPGNVQQLRNAIEHAAILAADGVIRGSDLPDWVEETETARRPRDPGPAGPARRFKEAKREVVETFERAYLRTLLDRHAGNVTAASQESGMLRSALQRLLRKHGLKSASFRKPRGAPAARAESHKILPD